MFQQIPLDVILRKEPKQFALTPDNHRQTQKVAVSFSEIKIKSDIESVILNDGSKFRCKADGLWLVTLTVRFD